MKLTVLADRRPETTLCTYCPKLCRPACPVSTVEGRETVTPWGKMRALGEVLREVVPHDGEHLTPAYACTGCMRCFELCDLDNPVADTLRDGRKDAVSRGVAPAEVHGFIERFPKREAALVVAAEAFGNHEGRVAFVPGCTAVTFHRDEVPSIASAIHHLHSRCSIVADRCCGLPLLDAGDVAGFATRARAMTDALQEFDRVVTIDAGCAHAFRVAYPKHGFTLPRVQHIAELAAGVLPTLPKLAHPPARAVYHDPCRLGRGLGVYDAPRAVLSRLLHATPGELPERREYAPCSGGGGLLPITRRATADGIAGELAGLARDAGAETVVTACPTSRRMLARQGVHAVDLSVLIARAFGAR